MFLGLQGEYIASVAETRAELEAVAEIAGFNEIVETSEPVQYVGGKFIVGIENITSALKEMREQAYTKEVDGITAHIQRLRDKEQTPEIVAEIEQLIAERDAKVEEIKQRYPYPTDPVTESEENADTQN